MLCQTRALIAPLLSASKPVVKAAAALTLSLAVVTACSPAATQTPDPNMSSPPSATQTLPAEGVAETLEMDEAWAKSAQADDDHAMTGIFGLIHNPSAEPISLVGATTDVAAVVELHETVIDATGTTVMQAVETGFLVAPGETLTLEPGGDHIMLMELTQDLIAGDQVSVTLTLSTGDTMDVVAEIRDFSGAQETYSHEETDTEGDQDKSHDH